MKKLPIIALAALLSPACFANLTPLQQEYLKHASISNQNGWIHISIHGKPYERGFQHGYLAAKPFKRAYQDIKHMIYKTTGLTMDTVTQVAVNITKNRIPKEYLKEMQGIADGLTAAGVPMTLNQIIGWNDYPEVTGYWWPSIGSRHFERYVKPGFKNLSELPIAQKPIDSRHFKMMPLRLEKHKYGCSAFIATGKSTKDGKIVIGHESFVEFYQGQTENVVLDITPDKGHRMVFQTAPGWIQSGTDFWVTGAGLVVVETTIANQTAFTLKGIPEFVRARYASQYANNIKDWVSLMQEGNNGGIANTWLLGNIHTNKIAQFVQGLYYQRLKMKDSGYFTGNNMPSDPRIQHVSGRDSGFSDIRQQTGARRLRWIQLMSKYNGKIDLAAGQKMLADTYDVYLNRSRHPSSRTICAEYDKDPQPYVDDPAAVWNVPYYPAGSVDAKVTTADMAEKMMFSGRWGRANGDAFDVNAFLKAHAQWAWQRPYLWSRPSEPWHTFMFK